MGTMKKQVVAIAMWTFLVILTEQSPTTPFDYQFHWFQIHQATVNLMARDENGKETTGPCGVLRITDLGSSVAIEGRITGLRPGPHGLHIHKEGDLRDRCNAAGPHYNPQMVKHGAPNDIERHVGDLGNIYANENGVAEVDIQDHCVLLNGPYSVTGRTMVVHKQADDLGRGGTEVSEQNGSAGERVSCGVIEPTPQYAIW